MVPSLKSALWAFYRSESFEEGCLLAVNLGGDADTTGTIFGQLGGAFCGERAIPERWLSRLAWRERIAQVPEQLNRLAGRWGQLTQ